MFPWGAALPPYAAPGGCYSTPDPELIPATPEGPRKAIARDWHLDSAQEVPSLTGCCRGGLPWVLVPWLPPHPRRRPVSPGAAKQCRGHARAGDGPTPPACEHLRLEGVRPPAWPCVRLLQPVGTGGLGPGPSTLGPEWPAAGWAQGPDLTARGSLTLRGAARPQMASPVHAPPASAATSPAINSRLPIKSALPAQEAFNSQPPPQSARCPWGGKPRGPAPGQCGGSERSFKPPSVTSGFNFLYEICTFPPRAFITWYIIKTFTATSEDSGRWAANSSLLSITSSSRKDGEEFFYCSP